MAAGPLPGQTLVVLDPDCRLIVDAFPCQDGHAQERSLLTDVVDSMEAKEVWIGDRNFCTSMFLFQTAANDAYFAMRQHATNVRWEAAGRRRKIARIETGVVYQQRVVLSDNWGNRLSVRRITIKLGPADRRWRYGNPLTDELAQPREGDSYCRGISRSLETGSGLR